MTLRGGDHRSGKMPAVDALEVLADLCSGDQIVVTNQGSARILPKLRRRPLDFHYNPSTMGGAVPLALGLALAQPQREVLVVSGDGSLLMSLGVLVTVVKAGVTNLAIVLLDNGIYEVTGGQETPATPAVDYCGLARAAGFASACSFQQLADWQARAADALSEPGPRFIRLAVQTAPNDYLRFPTPPMDEQLAQLRRALGAAARS
ncbi:MAG: thiamine pyrophosphate-dependent enzyme [Planctomycetaceae bacterium]|nr:thiamine pyrophosphate-dependent enzyme [Planctomycetaceae bacterium]